MKALAVISLILTLFVEYAKAQQDTLKPKLIAVEDASKHLGEFVTVFAQAADFDPRGQNKYLYFESNYPNQQLPIIIKNNEVNPPIKLKWSVMARKSKEYFTGTVTAYNEEPDTSVRTDAKRIKKEWDGKTIYFYSDGKRITGSVNHVVNIPLYPVDLRGKPVIIITEQNQIGRN